jgi:hypothetical protein
MIHVLHSIGWGALTFPCASISLGFTVWVNTDHKGKLSDGDLNKILILSGCFAVAASLLTL